MGMSEKEVENQINHQAGIKTCASGTNRKLMTFNKKAPFRDSVT